MTATRGLNPEETFDMLGYYPDMLDGVCIQAIERALVTALVLATLMKGPFAAAIGRLKLNAHAAPANPQGRAGTAKAQGFGVTAQHTRRTESGRRRAATLPDDKVQHTHSKTRGPRFLSRRRQTYIYTSLVEIISFEFKSTICRLRLVSLAMKR